MISIPADIVLLDIEGTVAPISFVTKVLFPLARQELQSFLQTNWKTEQVQAARKQMATDAGDPILNDDVEKLIAEAHRLMDVDAKATGLKMLQGLIWDASYRAGKLRSELFSDVLPALSKWKSSGKQLAIYSSGSVAAQRVFFKYTTDGDASPLLSGYFDTTSGPKRSADSYRNISKAINTPASRFLFLTDILEEAIAARDAGMHAAILLRPGNAPLNRETDLPVAHTFAEITLA